MLSRKKCPPFCNSNCDVQHHKLILSLLNIQENERKTIEKFKRVVNRYQDLKPEDPIPDPCKEYRYPLMHWAGVLGKISALEHLLEIGHPADLKSTDKSEGTMHRVVLCITSTMRTYKLDQIIKRFKSLVDLLSDALFITDDSGNTPLHSCAVYIAELNNQFQLSFYKTALEIMIHKVVEIEDQHHTSTSLLNRQNKEGNTILHIICNGKQQECLEIATKLLQNNVHIYVKNSDDETAYDIARNNSRKIAKLLKLYGHKQEQRDHDATFFESVSSSAEGEVGNLSTNCNMSLLNADHNIVSSTSREEINILQDKSTSRQQASCNPATSSCGPNAKRRKLAQKVKPTLIKNEDSCSSATITRSLDDTASDENISNMEANQTWESMPSASSRIRLGSISDEDHNEFIRPNLTNLLKQVGQERPVLDLMQKNQKDLQESIKTSERKIADINNARQRNLTDIERMIDEVDTKTKELENLKNELEGKNDVINSLNIDLQDEEAVLINLNNELIVYNEISKCLSSN